MGMPSLRRFLTLLLAAGTCAVVLASCAGGLRRAILPPPDLNEPVGRTTLLRLQSLRADDSLCRAVLDQAQLRYAVLPPLRQGECGYTLTVRYQPDIALRPSAPGMSCAMAAGVHLWLRDVVAPAAQAHYGSPLAAVDHFGTYSCRRIYGGETGNLSEHARANAFDVSGFSLQSGRQISIARHWNGSPPDQAFLREIRDGACRIFGTTLSPDYNAAHADHFYLDMAARGFGGYCR